MKKDKKIIIQRQEGEKKTQGLKCDSIVYEENNPNERGL